MLRIPIVLACLAAAAASLMTLREHDRCEDARAAVFAGADEAVAAVREHCRGTTALLSVAGALHARGEDDQAGPLALEAARAEPEDPRAWRAVAATAAPSSDEGREAVRRLRVLDPSFRASAGRSTR